MGKKYAEKGRMANEMSIEEEVNLDIVELKKEDPVIEVKKNAYEVSNDKLLTEINTLANGEDRSRAIKDLEVMERINTERKKRELEEKKAEDEKILRKNELALQKEQVKNNKKSTWVGALVQIGTTALSFLAYGVLLNRQNAFEKDDNYSTQGSRNLMNNIGRLPKIR